MGLLDDLIAGLTSETAIAAALPAAITAIAGGFTAAQNREQLRENKETEMAIERLRQQAAMERLQQELAARNQWEKLAAEIQREQLLQRAYEAAMANALTGGSLVQKGLSDAIAAIQSPFRYRLVLGR